MSVYRDFEIFPFRPDWVQAVETTFERDRQVFQTFGPGAFWSNRDATALKLKMGLTLIGKDEIQTLRLFFDAMRGRWGGFWLPTWHSDLRPASALAADDLVLTVTDSGWGDYWSSRPGIGRYLFFLFPDGEEKIREAVGRPGPDRIRLNTSLGRSVDEAEINNLFISFFLFVRFDQDALELDFKTETVARTQIIFQTLSHEEPDPATTTTTTTTTSTTSTTFTSTTTGTTTTTAPPCSVWSSNLCTGGSCAADGSIDASHACGQAFDGSDSTFWQSGGPPAPHWIGYDFGSGQTRIPARIRIYQYDSNNNTSRYKVQGSNTGFTSDLTDLLVVTDGGAGWEDRLIDNTAGFRFVRIWAEDGFSHALDYWAVREIELYECRDGQASTTTSTTT